MVESPRSCLVRRVLFLGEINVDLILGGLESFPIPDREVLCHSFGKTIGSSTAICACVYASLGGDASFLGLAGKDEYGDFMVNGMADFGIETALVKRTSKVGTGVTINLIHGQNRTQVTYPGAIAEFGPDHFSFDDLEGCDHIHTGGPYPQTRLIGEISSILEFAGRNGITTSIDTQWDPSEQWSHLQEWLPKLDFFFCNEDEAVSMTGAQSPEKACLKLNEWTACPAVKIGAQGVLIPHRNTVMRIPSPTIEVVDNTGAGDSFDAGFLFARLEKGMSPEKAAEFACGVAARSCTFVGGVNARSSFSDVIKFLGDHENDSF
jgi:sugar/nucleoside kinase (ribokinase family)